MKVLIDISHPAHVHFYRYIYRRLINEGAGVLVVAREKDVTLRLLEAFKIPHLTVGRSGHRNLGGQFGELVRRDLFLFRHGRKMRPDVVLTRNPSGVQAARVLRATGVFDTDDGRSVGVHYRAAAPFAHVITAPDSLTESFGRKGRKYSSYKSLAYLHPDVYTPSPHVRKQLGVGDNEPYSVVRLVAHDASHDRHARGLAGGALREVIATLARHGQVFVSAEAGTVAEESVRRLAIPPELMHDALAEAKLVVGDSQTVITEAALLGTPGVRINTWAAASPHLTELEHRYGLVRNFYPEQVDEALAVIDQLANDPSTSAEWQHRRALMLSEKVNLTDWYFDLILELADR